MTTMNVLDAAGATVAIEKPLTPGRAADATSRPVALSNEDVAILGIVTETAPASDTASSGHNGRLQRIAQNLTTMLTGIILAAGSNLIGRAVADASSATGGVAFTFRIASAAASTNGQNVTNVPCRVYAVAGKNNAAYDVFVVLYNTTVSPTVGTTAIRRKFVCPAGQAFVYDFPLGLSFNAGLSLAFTKLVADADTTAVAAADITAFNTDYS